MPDYDGYKRITLTDPGAIEVVERMAKTDDRSAAYLLSQLALQEYARRFSKPNPTITIEDAVSPEEVAERG